MMRTQRTSPKVAGSLSDPSLRHGHTPVASTKRHASRSHVATSGFVLLEIILALGLFSLVAVAMTRALDQIAHTSQMVHREAQVMRVLESVLAEVVHQPMLKAGSVHFDAGADGVEARASIEHIELTTRNKNVLDHMFQIRVKAWIPDGRAHVMERQMETYVYSPNSPEK